ncbi:MAG: AMP-binding protein [Desulfobacteraceae bacterium]|nr:AMP-binding protein [Desulfobacteraceae bacterium]
MDSALEKNLIQRIAVGDVFRKRARNTPNRIAIVEHRGEERHAVTFWELNQELNRFVDATRALGLKKGGKVALLGLNSTEYLIALYGTAKAGLTAVPINPGMAPVDIAYVLNHAGADCIVLDSLLVPLMEAIRETLGTVKQMIVIRTGEEPVPPAYMDFYAFMAKGLTHEPEDVIINDRDIFEILYTSGTTGRPKGVLVSHLSVYISSLSSAIEFSMAAGTTTTMVLPVFHCAQQVLTYAALNAGGTVTVVRQFDPGQFLETIEAEKVNLTFCLPMMYRMLLDHPDIGTRNLENLHTCVYAMTPMDQPTLEECIEIFRADFIHGTGQTECFPPTNIFRASDRLDKQGNYWGDSNLILDTAIMDEAGKLLPPNQIGEIVWRGPLVMESYYKDEEATTESRKFGWHHSGDLGMIDDDGLLLFVDRKKDMIKSGGENVASIKVERVILADPRVRQVAVVGTPHPHWVEQVTAFVVTAPDSGLSEDAVIQVCKKELGRFEVPKKVVFVDGLPMTSTGKIKKNLLRQMAAD